MELLDSCFVKGTGLTFIDQILSSQQSVDGIGNTNGNDNGNAEGNCTTRATAGTKNTVIEIIGKSETGKSKVLMSLAANYVACTTNTTTLPTSTSTSTSTSFLSLGSNSTTAANATVTAPTAPSLLPVPFVIILDPEHTINIQQLRDYIVSATLRRWNKTDQFREYYNKACCLLYQKRNNNDHNDNDECDNNKSHNKNSNNNNNYADHFTFDQEVLAALDHIHII